MTSPARRAVHGNKATSRSRPDRPTLVTNGRLMRDFMAASTPCCTLGLLEEYGAPSAFFALRPHRSIRPRNTRVAFNHGHALLGSPQREVLQFGFTFFELSTYHVLINPIDVVAQRVLDSIMARGHYFVFAINPDNRTTAFRADLTRAYLERLAEFRRRTRGSSTTEAQYRDTVAQFRAAPNPPGDVLEWVCRDNLDYLELTQNRLDVSPVA